jgi:uncharacterized membrane protein (UPF0136 family)
MEKMKLTFSLLLLVGGLYLSFQNQSITNDALLGLSIAWATFHFKKPINQ